MNRYTNRERAAVKSVVVDLNDQYIKFIKALFPNARIIIDRFHIVQLVGRTLGNARISLMKKMNDMVLFTERNSSKQRFSGSLANLDFNSTASSIILMTLEGEQ